MLNYYGFLSFKGSRACVIEFEFVTCAIICSIFCLYRWLFCGILGSGEKLILKIIRHTNGPNVVPNQHLSYSACIKII